MREESWELRTAPWYYFKVEKGGRTKHSVLQSSALTPKSYTPIPHSQGTAPCSSCVSGGRGDRSSLFPLSSFFLIFLLYLFLLPVFSPSFSLLFPLLIDSQLLELPNLAGSGLLSGLCCTFLSVLIPRTSPATLIMCQ